MLELIANFINAEQKEKLQSLIDLMREKQLFALAAGPYPVNHGEKHISKVMGRVGKLIEAIGVDRLPDDAEITKQEVVFELAAAVLIHDVAMGAVAVLSESGDKAHRQMHASLNRLQDYLKSEHGFGAFLLNGHMYQATLMAWSHAGDHEYSASEKEKWINETFGTRAGSLHLPLCMRILRFADLLDVEPYRLNPLPKDHDLREDQFVHRDKHRLVKVALGPSRIELQRAQPLPAQEIHASAAAVEAIRHLKQDIQDQLGGLSAWLVGWKVVDDLEMGDWIIESENDVHVPPPSSHLSERNETLAINNAPPTPQPFVGRQRDLDSLFFRLTGQVDQERQQLVGLHGVPGVGKSTFLSHFAWDRRIQGVFPDGVLWAALGQQTTAERQMLTDWCQRVGVEAAGLLEQEMAAKLGERIFGKRVLLLIDDVWRQKDLGLVQHLLHPTVAMVFTSRVPALAYDVASEKGAQALSVLDEEAALSVLQFFAPHTVKQYGEKCHELVHKLDGLPLALQVAGRLLAACQRHGFGTEEMFESLQDGATILAEKPPANMRPFIEETNENLTIAGLIQRSVAFLPKQGRKCFFCLGVMAPKPATFDLEDIQNVWHFLDDPLPELTKLIDMGLIEPLNNGRFQMHAMLVAYAKARLLEATDLESL